MGAIVVALIGATALILNTIISQRRNQAAHAAVVEAKKAVTENVNAIAGVHDEVRTNHGRRMGEYVEQIAETVSALADNQKLVMREQAAQRRTLERQGSFLEAHSLEDTRQFGLLTEGQATLNAGQERLEATVAARIAEEHAQEQQG